MSLLLLSCLVPSSQALDSETTYFWKDYGGIRENGSVEITSNSSSTDLTFHIGDEDLTRNDDTRGMIISFPEELLSFYPSFSASTSCIAGPHDCTSTGIGASPQGKVSKGEHGEYKVEIPKVTTNTISLFLSGYRRDTTFITGWLRFDDNLQGKDWRFCLSSSFSRGGSRGPVCKTIHIGFGYPPELQSHIFQKTLIYGKEKDLKVNTVGYFSNNFLQLKVQGEKDFQEKKIERIPRKQYTVVQTFKPTLD